jgi:hypothetical protein
MKLLVKIFFFRKTFLAVSADSLSVRISRMRREGKIIIKLFYYALESERRKKNSMAKKKEQAHFVLIMPSLLAATI